LLLALASSIIGCVLRRRAGADEYREFKLAASVVDSCAICLALVGNVSHFRILYWPFLMVHAIFIGTLAILSSAIFIMILSHLRTHSLVDFTRLQSKEERMLTLMIINFVQFILHCYVYKKTWTSYQYLGERQRANDADLLPSLLMLNNKDAMIV